MGIGTKLDALMKERGTNANELAVSIGTAPTTIYSMIKRDSRKADINLLMLIARHFGVEMDYFCDMTEAEKAAAQMDRPADGGTQTAPSFETIAAMVARSNTSITAEERLKLIQMLSGQ